MSILQQLSPLLELIGSLIGSCAIVIAAWLGVRELNNIAQKRLNNYRDKDSNISELLVKAKNEITIVVAYGDTLVTELSQIIEWCLSRGVAVRYLMLTVDAAKKMNHEFFDNTSVDTAKQVNMVKNALEKMKKNGKLEVREWSRMLPVSYIGIDIGKDCRGHGSIIHMMPYLYNTRTDNSPISYLTYDSEKTQFEVTAESIEKMWEHARTVQYSV